MNLNINNDWFTVTETGIVFSDDFSKEQWTELGKELARNSKNLMWMIGDWLIAGSHPDRKYLPEGKRPTGFGTRMRVYNGQGEQVSVDVQVDLV